MDKRRKNSVNWRIGYAVCCLVYVGCVLYLSVSNFEMVHNQKRRAARLLQPEQVEKIALQELVDKCRRKLKRAGRFPEAGEENPCLSWPEDVLAEQQMKVNTYLVEEKSRVDRKLVSFYVSFGLVFLFLPIAFGYLLMSFLVWLLRNIKIIE